MSNEDIRPALAKRWGLAPEVSDANLISELAHRVAWLMKHDYQRLLNAVYLLDIPERRFNEASSLPTNEATARSLAELIIQRERQKLESRRRYRRDRSTDVAATEVDESKLRADHSGDNPKV